MHKILDYLNGRDFAINTVGGAKDAVHFLLRNEPERLNHTLGVVERMKTLLTNGEFDREFEEVCLQSAYLHDIGYSEDFAFSGFHPYDGYFYLKENGWREAVSYSVLHHTYAESLMELTAPELAHVYKNVKTTSLGLLVTQLVTLADLHTDSSGNLTTISGRIKGVAERHGADSMLVKHLTFHTEDTEKLMERWGSPLKPLLQAID